MELNPSPGASRRPLPMGEVGRSAGAPSGLDSTSRRSIEQTRRVIDDGAFDREHFQLGHDAAIGGEPTGLAAGGQHAVAGHDDRTGIAPERLADIARQLDAAEPFGDIAVSERLARWDGACDLVD